MISSILAACVSLSTPSDCGLGHHPNYDAYWFRTYQITCPNGVPVDTTCAWFENRYYLRAIDDIDLSFQTQVCICYDRWLVNHDDAAFARCYDMAVRTALDSFNAAESLYTVRFVTWCCGATE